MAKQLAQFQGGDQAFQLMQNSWAQTLAPLLQNPLTNGIILKSVPLVSGSNSINHKLGRALQGWCVVRQRASATLYDTQDTNPTPNLTLQLTASGAVTVDLYVF